MKLSKNLYLLFIIFLALCLQFLGAPLDGFCLASGGHATADFCKGAASESADQHLAHLVHIDPVFVAQSESSVSFSPISHSLPCSRAVTLRPRTIAPPEQPPRSS